jgi:hypothetical protein
MSVTEITTLVEGVREISRSERKLFTLAELKDGGGSAFERALDWMRDGEMDWDWWTTTLDCEVDHIRATYGFIYDPKQVSFDLDRGNSFCFGKAPELDDRVFLKRAGIDLRTKAARTIIEDGRLIVGVSHGYSSWNWIGYYEYECIPDYIEEMSPGITEKLQEVLRDAQYEMLTTLRAEQDYLTSEAYLLERAAEQDDLWFDEYGRRA